MGKIVPVVKLRHAKVVVSSRWYPCKKQYDPSHYEKTHPLSILQVPTTQLAKMSIDPKFVELTADVLEIFL